MNLNTSQNQIQQALMRIRSQWQRSSSLWDDVVRWEFEREFWQPIERQAISTKLELEKLSQVITQAQQNVN